MMSSTPLDLGLMTAPIGLPGAPLAVSAGSIVPDFARALTDLMTGTAPAALAPAVSVPRQDVAVVGKNLPIERVPSPGFKNRPVCELLDPGLIPALPSAGAAQVAERPGVPADPEDPQQEPALAWLMPPSLGPAPVPQQPAPLTHSDPVMVAPNSQPIASPPTLAPAGYDCEMPADAPQPIGRAPTIADDGPRPEIAPNLSDCEMPVDLPDPAAAQSARHPRAVPLPQSGTDVPPVDGVPVKTDAESRRAILVAAPSPGVRPLRQPQPDILVPQTPSRDVGASAEPTGVSFSADQVQVASNVPPLVISPAAAPSETTRRTQPGPDIFVLQTPASDVAAPVEVAGSQTRAASAKVPIVDPAPTRRAAIAAVPSILVLQTPLSERAEVGGVTVPSPPVSDLTRPTAGPNASSQTVEREPPTALSEARSRAVVATRLELQPAALPVRDNGATLAFAAAVRAAPAVAEPVSSTVNATLPMDAGSLAPIAAGAPAAAPVAAPPQAGIDLTRDPGLHRMIDRIEHLRDTFDVRETRIRLIPDALGPVDIAVRRDGAGDAVQVHFTAAEVGTRQLIAEAQQRLVELADARGVRIERATIDGGVGSGQPWSNGEGQPRQQQQGHATQPRAPVRAGRDSEPQNPEDRIA